ncbi:hypothetical protein BGZ59_011624 [Podila verticillata]|nr:hypothetical protein BGZ59_011624 [Podila verticillata]KFH65013.1 hypothetical protein MVEG_09741 [Podila verticillata NRRL 6337]
MPKEKKTAATRGDKNEKLVLDYLIKQNRPYSITDIVSNLHNEVSKTDCQKVVNSLVENDLVTSKLYGKQSIYVVRQDTIDTASPEQLAVVDREIAELQNKIGDRKTHNKQLSSELNLLSSTMTTEQITEKLNTLAAKNEKASQNLELLRSGSKLVTPEAKQKVVKEMEYHRKLWRDRRRVFKEMFQQVTDNMPGKPKDLLEELDIEMNDPIDIGTDPRDLLQA